MDNEYCYENIISNLKNEKEDDFVKIFSILNLEKISSLEDAHIVINHLTNHPTPIREALAYKLEDIYKETFFDDFIKQKFLDSIVDINPNVSRAICSLISKSPLLEHELKEGIILKIKKLLLEIKDNTNKKSHAKNKKLFSLYWLLEALSVCCDERFSSDIIEILKFTITFSDYTIREKTAKILTKMPNPPLVLLQIAKSDTNFYVKNQVYDKINFDD